MIEEALVQAVANTSPNVPKVRSSFELDSVERVQEVRSRLSVVCR